ncbi:MAG: esterase-like activity of phytase family protein, partial [Erythrobacter sp.]
VSGKLALSGAWELTAKHGWFGGFSALVQGDGQTLIAGTDRGFRLNLDLSGDVPRAVPGSFRFVGLSGRGREEVIDLESLTRDPASGTVWAGFENRNFVSRWAVDGTRTIVAPPAMAEWSRNSGAETLERLADGRFLMIAEGTERGSDTLHQGLLFPADPVAGSEPDRFRFAAPADFDPVDAAQLPDGRALILLRRVGYAIPAKFDTAVAIADPRLIRADRPWQAEVLARLEGGIFADNFEGIAYVGSATDPSRGAIWLISDDNMSLFQRTLLVRFDWHSAAIR